MSDDRSQKRKIEEEDVLSLDGADDLDQESNESIPVKRKDDTEKLKGRMHNYLKKQRQVRQKIMMIITLVISQLKTTNQQTVHFATKQVSVHTTMQVTNHFTVEQEIELLVAQILEISEGTCLRQKGKALVLHIESLQKE